MSSIQGVLSADLNPEFVETLRSEFFGAYRYAYWDLAQPAGRFVPTRNDALDQASLALLHGQRWHLGNLALMKACKQLKVPAEMKLLPYNGRRFAVAQMGRVILIQEPITFIEARPASAQYKQRLAETHLAMRQLEMEFPDEEYRRRIEAKDTMLATVLHGFRGETFDQSSTSLSIFDLAVPDSSYSSWLWRDCMLTERTAARLGWSNVSNISQGQADQVSITWRGTNAAEEQQ